MVPDPLPNPSSSYRVLLEPLQIVNGRPDITQAPSIPFKQDDIASEQTNKLTPDTTPSSIQLHSAGIVTESSRVLGPKDRSRTPERIHPAHTRESKKSASLQPKPLLGAKAGTISAAKSRGGTAKDKPRANQFTYNSQDEHIRRALKKFGWVESSSSSSISQFNWVYTDQEAHYRTLREGQYYNHIPNNRELTTKNGLMNNFRTCLQPGLEIEQFFPRCYDVGNIEHSREFREDYERTALTILIRKLWKHCKLRIDSARLSRIKTKHQSWEEKNSDGERPKRKSKRLKVLVLVEDQKDPDFVVQSVLLELAILSAKAIIEQQTEVVESISYYSLPKLDKGTRKQLIHYSRLNPPYTDLTAADLVSILHSQLS